MKKKKRRGAWLLYLVIAACIAAVGYSGYKIYDIQAEYAKGDKLYAGLKRELAPGRSMPEGSANGAQGNAEAGSPLSQIDFEALRAHNPDSVGWISIKDTAIDYPVVQGRDNEYYLDHLFSGAYGIAGSIFMEVTNAPDFSDRNTIIFGHHMKNGSMFAGLDKYRSQDYYEQHPSGALYTPAGDYVVEWFAGYAITAAPLPIGFGSETDFMDYVEQAFRQSHFKADVDVLPTDRIVTLCTCSYVSDDARYILMGVLR